MLRVLIAITFLFGASPLYADDLIKNGDVVFAPNSLQLSLRNPDDISEKWKYGASCFTQDTGMMAALGIDGDRVLIMYRIIGGMGLGVWCPDKVISFISRTEWIKAAAFTKKQYADDAAAEQDRAIVQKLLREYFKNK